MKFITLQKQINRQSVFQHAAVRLVVCPTVVGIFLSVHRSLVQELGDMQFGHSLLLRRLGRPLFCGQVRAANWPLADPVQYVILLAVSALEIFYTQTALSRTVYGGRLLALR